MKIKAQFGGLIRTVGRACTTSSTRARRLSQDFSVRARSTRLMLPVMLGIRRGKENRLVPTIYGCKGFLGSAEIVLSQA